MTESREVLLSQFRTIGTAERVVSFGCLDRIQGGTHFLAVVDQHDTRRVTPL